VTEAVVGPTKARELHNHHFDSTIWNDLQVRDDDIIIATYAKSGTTWMQQIVAQMLFGPDPELEVAEMSPWLDLRIPPKAVKLTMVEAQTRRRFLKTHLPLDALVFSPKCSMTLAGPPRSHENGLPSRLFSHQCLELVFSEVCQGCTKYFPFGGCAGYPSSL
jgi:aryl sulfotransferase